MAKTYDAVLKHLVEAYPAAWLKSLRKLFRRPFQTRP